MREDRPFIEYLNEVDAQGKPIKHIHWPEELPKPVERLIIKIILDEFKHSGLPIGESGETQRQELFSFLRRLKSTWDIIFKAVIPILVVAVMGAAVYLIKVDK